MNQIMKSVDIEGIVHLSSKERYAALLGGICILVCGIMLNWFIFTFIPVEIAIPHIIAVFLGLVFFVYGISFVLLAIHPAKTYAIQEIAESLL